MARISNAARDRFLAALADGASIRGASKAAGHDPKAFYRIAERENVFAEAWRIVVATHGTDAVEDKLIEIAMGAVKANHTQLLACFGILRARRPAVWRELKNGDTPTAAPEVPPLDLTQLSEQELADLRELVRKARPPLTAVA